MGSGASNADARLSRKGTQDIIFGLWPRRVVAGLLLVVGSRRSRQGTARVERAKMPCGFSHYLPSWRAGRQGAASWGQVKQEERKVAASGRQILPPFRFSAKHETLKCGGVCLRIMSLLRTFSFFAGERHPACDFRSSRRRGRTGLPRSPIKRTVAASACLR